MISGEQMKTLILLDDLRMGSNGPGAGARGKESMARIGEADRRGRVRRTGLKANEEFGTRRYMHKHKGDKKAVPSWAVWRVRDGRGRALPESKWKIVRWVKASAVENRRGGPMSGFTSGRSGRPPRRKKGGRKKK